MKRATSFIFLFLIIGLHQSKAQLSKDIFPLNRQFYKSGFYVSPTLTHSFTWNEGSGSIRANDTLYDYTASGKGKLRYGIEIGLFQTFEKPRLIHYIEGGIFFRQFEGSEKHEGAFAIADTITPITSENSFTMQNIGFSFRAIRADQLGKFTFLQSGIGVNGNYLLGSSYKRSEVYPIGLEKFPENIQAQAHFIIGLGIRLTETVLFIPSIEVPFFNAYPYDGIESRYGIFSNQYQPILFHFKFMILRKDPMNCNSPTYNGIPQ